MRTILFNSSNVLKCIRNSLSGKKQTTSKRWLSSHLYGGSNKILLKMSPQTPIHETCQRYLVPDMKRRLKTVQRPSINYTCFEQNCRDPCVSLDGSPHQWSHVIYVQSINHCSTRYLEQSLRNQECTQFSTANGYWTKKLLVKDTFSLNFVIYSSLETVNCICCA